jgi:hypothetical protein
MTSLWSKRISVLFTFCSCYHSGHQIKKTEMGRACSTYGERNVYADVGGGNLREGDYLKYPGIDNIKMDIRDMGWGGGESLDWIYLAQDRDR